MVPKEIDERVRALVEKVDPSHEPIYVNVWPEKGAEISDCFRVVERKVQQDGGRMVLGWQVWQTKHLIEAECHAVWEKPNGDLLDITPKQFKTKRILFLEDENVVYDGRQIDNIRLNISGNALADDLIMISEENYAFLNRGDRANSYELVLTNEQRAHYEYIQSMQYMVSTMLRKNNTRESTCLCNSGQRYSECHGNNLLQKLRAVQ